MDDFILMHEDKEYLKSVRSKLEQELLDIYKLKLNKKKTILSDSKTGFPFVVTDLELLTIKL